METPLNISKKVHASFSFLKSSNFEKLWCMIVNKLEFKIFNANKYSINNVMNNVETKIIIYNDKKIIIEMNDPEKLTKIFFKRIFAVRDRKQPNRFFIGFTFYNYTTNYSIAGIMIYFDDKNIGKCNIIYDNIICEYDIRNNVITEENSILYNQTLIFHYKHRDTYKMVLHMNLLSFDDKLIGQSVYHTDYRVNDYEKYLVNIGSRFICIFGPDENYVVFDAASLTLIENNNDQKYKYLNIEVYEINKFGLDQFIILAKDLKEEEYSDGYPSKCIKCKENTHIAIYGYNFTSMGLGNSYCPKCEIRFSKERNYWVCAKLKEDKDHMCLGELQKDCFCNRPHSISHKIVISKEKEETKTIKPPYKKTLYLTNEPI